MNKVLPAWSILVIIIGMTTGCSQKPDVVVNRIYENGNLSFEMEMQGGNGLLEMAIWDPESRELIWALNLAYLEQGTIAFGEVPGEFQAGDGNARQIKQTFPKDNRSPSELQRNTQYFLEVKCQYDTLVSANFKRFYFTFTTDADGIPSEISEVEAITSSELPIDRQE